MAEGKVLVCDNCAFDITAWSDGNPYYIDRQGKKRYAYHPDHAALARCIGNDSPVLCLECGEEVMSDSRSPATSCPKCASSTLVPTWELEGRKCPRCRTGAFTVDEKGGMVS